ncbi:myelin basic protein-like [Astyanax mexicanus]|uniref:Myelin basic protein n=1 Tax=Astyanax mexicanus TaxID=7994 RepID=A0A8T2MBS1_ASTMX|nr:myelin basic protein-like [Astyanax mexicanus]
MDNHNRLTKLNCLKFCTRSAGIKLSKRSVVGCNACCFSAGLNEPDVNQNKECSGKSAGTTSSPTPEQANQSDPGAAGLRPHLVRLFSRDAPGREDNTFKERPSESDELHTIPEAGAELDDLLENEDEDAEKTS